MWQRHFVLDYPESEPPSADLLLVADVGEELLVELALEVAGPGGGVGGEHAPLGEYDDPPAGSLEGEQVVGGDLMGEYDAELAALDGQGKSDQPGTGRHELSGHGGREVGLVPVQPEHRLGEAGGA